LDFGRPVHVYNRIFSQYFRYADGITTIARRPPEKRAGSGSAGYAALHNDIWRAIGSLRLRVGGNIGPALRHDGGQRIPACRDAFQTVKADNLHFRDYSVTGQAEDMPKAMRLTRRGPKPDCIMTLGRTCLIQRK